MNILQLLNLVFYIYQLGQFVLFIQIFLYLYWFFGSVFSSHYWQKFVKIFNYYCRSISYFCYVSIFFLLDTYKIRIVINSHQIDYFICYATSLPLNSILPGIGIVMPAFFSWCLHYIAFLLFYFQTFCPYI